MLSLSSWMFRHVDKALNNKKKMKKSGKKVEKFLLRFNKEKYLSKQNYMQYP